MATPLPSTPIPGLSNVDAWQSVVGNAISGNFTAKAQSATQTYDIFLGGLSDFILEVLGYAVNASPSIGRQLPARHPQLPWLYASRINSVEGLAPDGQVAGPIGPYASFKLVRVTVQFEAPPYAVLPDGVIHEWERFTYVSDVQPESQFIQRQRTCLVWSASADTSPPGLTGQPIADSGGATILQVKSRFTLTWVQVPDDGFFGGGGFAVNGVGGAAKQLDLIGRVNDRPFMGCLAGTLLFLGFHPDPHPQPIPDPGISPVDLAWDVKFSFSFFNPPYDSSAYTGEIDDPVGHELAPAAGFPYWYRPQLDTATADADPFWRYRTGNFDDLFELN